MSTIELPILAGTVRFCNCLLSTADPCGRSATLGGWRRHPPIVQTMAMPVPRRLGDVAELALLTWRYLVHVCLRR